MSHWEEELQSLLASLGVSLEDGEASEVMPDDESADTLMPPSAQAAADRSNNEQREIVKREMQATVFAVDRLTRAGYLEPAVHHDVVRVLHALMRPAPDDANDSQEWQLTSAAAVLRFCRIVLRLTKALTQPE
ncbi:MAG TPA: hypothetical protein VKB76_15010 [Ktedonobacterales bacterium]|nr:hypothetical protein [Ktedonobacterales bacterium]